MFSEFIQFVTCQNFLYKGWIKFHCVCILYFIYTFICWWIPGYFQLWAMANIEHVCTNIPLRLCFWLFEYILRSESWCCTHLHIQELGMWQWHPTPVLLPGKSHGRRSLVGCSPWDMGSLRVRHDWATSLSLFTFMRWRRKWQPTPLFLPGESQGSGSLVGCRL